MKAFNDDDDGTAASAAVKLLRKRHSRADLAAGVLVNLLYVDSLARTKKGSCNRRVGLMSKKKNK